MSTESGKIIAGYGRTVDLPFDAALRKVEQALEREGFGILTRIDVKATLKKKLGVEFGRYEILGACNPPLAHRALGDVPEIGVMLPCNVVVREVEGATRVEVINAEAMAEMFSGPVVSEVAREVKTRLDRVLDSV